ncbi:MAG: DNA polymerase III subunit delta', partial [Betaproteobacteria bacterium]|nr:DNA polymerase III subunit delta' [Betaproteobacteria bacterium]
MIDILPWQQPLLLGLMARRHKLPHAMLIDGRQGVGKLEFAQAVAQSLLCEARQGDVACNTCSACGWFREGNHPDFRVLMPESLSLEEEDIEAIDESTTKEKKKSREIKIEQIRDIADFMTLTTHREGFRVLLIHPAEAMNPAAANALLKTLEEPPAGSVILLVTEQPGRLLATIRSRCQRLTVPFPEAGVALEWLQQQGVKEAEVALAAAGGAPLNAIAFAESDYQVERRNFIAALVDSESDYVAVAQSFEKSDLSRLVAWLQTWVSDLVLAHTTREVRHHRDQQQAIITIARQLELPKLFRYEAELRQVRRTVMHPLNVRLLLEQLLISYK